MIHRYLIGRYKLEKNPDQLIGRGTFSDVLTINDGCQQVFKIYKTSRKYRNVDIAESAFSEFQKTITALRSIRSKNVLKVVSAFLTEENHEDFRLCLVLERCEYNLDEYLKKKGCAMSLEKLRDFTIQITCGLSLLRDQYLSHIDLKPQNILLGYDRNFKLAEVDNIKIHTHVFSKFKEEVLNAPHPYMAPELKNAITATKSNHSQKLYGKINAEKANIYALGMIMFKCLHPTRATTTEDTKRFLLSKNNAVMYDLIDLMEHMLKDTSYQRASLEHVCFSRFLLRKALPAYVKIIGNIEHYRLHDGPSAFGLSRTPSSRLRTTATVLSAVSAFDKDKVTKRPLSPYVITCKENMIRLRSVDVANGWHPLDELKDFLINSNVQYDSERTRVFLFTGTNAVYTEEELGYNKTALTDVRLTDVSSVEKDANFVSSALENTKISKENIKVVSLGDYTNDFFGFCKNLEQYRIDDANDILIPAFCYAPNSDVLKVIHAYINQRSSFQYLHESNRSMVRQNIITISGSILRKYRKIYRYLWDHQVLVKTDFPAEELSCADVIHVDVQNFKSVLTKAKKFSPNVVLLSFAVCGNVSLTSYLESLKSARPSERCVLQ